MGRSVLAVLSAVALLGGCSEDDGGTDPIVSYDAEPILRQAAHEVIYPTYASLREEAEDLRAAVATLGTAPSEPALEAARSAWRAARVPWEQSEGFLFGPVSDEGLDPAIDSWPVNEIDLDAVLASDLELTPELVDGLADELKGFHTIEYLLFGADGEKPVEAFTAREHAYLTASATVLRDDTARLAAAWDPAGEDFGRLLIETGDGNPRYASQTAAMQELLEGMITIADEVANGKIHDPLSQQDVTLEESRFSRNSIADFQDNIRSIQNLYLGRRGAIDGPGVDWFVAEVDPVLDARVRAEIESAIAAIGAIPPPFTSAIFEAPASVVAAQTAVRTLLETLDGEARATLEEIGG